MAVFVTDFRWILIFWLDLVLPVGFGFVSLTKLTSNNVRDGAIAIGITRVPAAKFRLCIGRRQLEFFLHIPADLDLGKFEADVRSMLPKAGDARIVMNVVRPAEPRTGRHNA